MPWTEGGWISTDPNEPAPWFAGGDVNAPYVRAFIEAEEADRKRPAEAKQAAASERQRQHEERIAELMAADAQRREKRRAHRVVMKAYRRQQSLSRVKLPPGPRGVWLTFGPESAL